MLMARLFLGKKMLLKYIFPFFTKGQNYSESFTGDFKRFNWKTNGNIFIC